MSAQAEKPVPDGFTLHTENTSHLLLDGKETFLNPVQEFNRDLSVACISAWSEDFNTTKEEKWRISREKRIKTNKRRKVDNTTSGKEVQPPPEEEEEDIPPTQPVKQQIYSPYKVTILEALSATGLRSIRYAKEIPLVKYVIANDMSPAATEAMKRNVEYNGFEVPPSNDGKVRINEGDACTLMYLHREERKRVDVVDLDPYGTAAPFIDASVQCIKDGGLLCVTCTDVSILATNNYPEKCFSNYGGVPLKAEYSHESALRLVLHAISTSAARYGRYIQPLLSLSIDFYVRLFVRIQSSPFEVKRAITKTATYYVCTFCQAFYEQPLGRIVERKSDTFGNINHLFKIQASTGHTDSCPECNQHLHLAGPMWSGPIHDAVFAAKVLQHIEGKESSYGTHARMKGMLTLARDELAAPFYFTPSRMAGNFHSQTPTVNEAASALLNAGHKVSASHACPGSIKTDANPSQVRDVFRSFIKSNPVNLKNVSESSPTRVLLSKEPSTEYDFKKHPEVAKALTKIKILRYQENPTSYWGPGSRATGKKRKAQN